MMTEWDQKSINALVLNLHLTNKGQEDAVAHINTLMEDL